MMIEILHVILASLLEFLFYYPLFMAYLWMIGAIYYYRHWERQAGRRINNVPKLDSHPMVSLLVPCHNEGENIRDTIAFLNDQAYPNFEIIAINDGSQDNTGELLDQLGEEYPRLRVIHLAENQGKAIALRMGTLMSNSEYLICVDGDALLEKHATTWIVDHFLKGPRVGAVTGNPRIRTRSTLLGKIQVGEFSAIIGMIKRAQRIYGRVFTVSGVVAGFRKSALQQVGYWGSDTITDDIDISWRLQMNHWDIRFEPNALCYILMPETLKGLLKQRIRWAQGGVEALMKHSRNMFNWRKRRMWGVCIEYITSVFWAYLIALVAVFWAVGLFVDLPEELRFQALMPPGWNGIILGTTCLLQFAISIYIDSRYEQGSGRYYYWMVWYPFAYWIINVISVVGAVPKAIFNRHKRHGKWVSPDRGLR